MFTGLIADLGRVRAVQREEEGATLTIATRLAGDIGEGDSVAVNGVCLTATHVDGESFQAQAMEETLRRSSLAALDAGASVNLELALRADGRLGGHIVQGHVDGTGVITAIREEGFARVLNIDVAPAQSADPHPRALPIADSHPPDAIPTAEMAIDQDPPATGALTRYLVEKGSVGVDGVSLTISALHDGGFSVSLIPETLKRTNLGGVAVGERVNLEVDILAKHVERLMEARL
jgi:riboflavin synthase